MINILTETIFTASNNFAITEQSSLFFDKWGTIAAWIALIVAIISPVITAIITNIHQTKLKRLTIYEQKGLDAMECYLTVTSHEITTTGVSDEYKKMHIKVLLYAPEKSLSDIENLHKLIVQTPLRAFPDKEKCGSLLVTISRDFSELIKK